MAHKYVNNKASDLQAASIYSFILGARRNFDMQAYIFQKLQIWLEKLETVRSEGSICFDSFQVR